MFDRARQARVSCRAHLEALVLIRAEASERATRMTDAIARAPT
jgi:hypothetical protein